MGAQHGSIQWHQLNSNDGDASRSFYRELFGWTYQTTEDPNVWPFSTGGARGGAIVHVPGGGNSWYISVAVDDVDTTVERAKQAGGTRSSLRMSYYPHGEVTWMEDPQGSLVGVVDASTVRNPDPGCDDGTEQMGPGPGQFCWYALTTSDLEAAKEFYAAVFGWSFVSMDGDANNMTIINQDFPIASLFGTPPDAKTGGWGVSIVVDDSETAATEAKGLGGELIMGPMHIGVGHNTVVTDPAGAVCTFFEVDEEKMQAAMEQF